MERERVSEAVIRRLPGYYRYLSQLERGGMKRISSQELGSRMGLTASQIRQDINCFGTLGQQGYGYNIPELRARIGEILGIGQDRRVALIGAGNIGQAVAQYPGFLNMGFRIRYIFDVEKPPVGEKIAGIRVQHINLLEEELSANPPDIAVLASPAEKAQSLADRLIAIGIRAIWNFAPMDIVVPDGVAVQNVQLTDSLLVLSYHLNKLEYRDE